MPVPRGQCFAFSTVCPSESVLTSSVNRYVVLAPKMYVRVAPFSLSDPVLIGIGNPIQLVSWTVGEEKRQRETRLVLW